MASIATATPITEVLGARCGDTILGDGGYIALKVAQRSGLSDDLTTAEAVIATQDGRAMRNGWHVGDEAEAVYFERYDITGRRSHGWIDSKTRQMVQAG